MLLGGWLAWRTQSDKTVKVYEVIKSNGIGLYHLFVECRSHGQVDSASAVLHKLQYECFLVVYNKGDNLERRASLRIGRLARGDPLAHCVHLNILERALR